MRNPGMERGECQISREQKVNPTHLFAGVFCPQFPCSFQNLQPHYSQLPSFLMGKLLL